MVLVSPVKVLDYLNVLFIDLDIRLCSLSLHKQSRPLAINRTIGLINPLREASGEAKIYLQLDKNKHSGRR